MTLDASTLRKWRELCDKATPGEWRAYSWPEFPRRDEYKKCIRIESETTVTAFCFGEFLPDAAFIAEARSALPLLLDAYEKLQGENERLHRVIAKELTENDEIGAEYTYVNCLRDENRKLRELLHDLNAVLKTAMHNGHHDLIQRVAEACEDKA